MSDDKPANPDSPNTGDELSRLLAKLRELDLGSPEREARIEELRRRVLAGEYDVNIQELADILIDQAFERHRKKRRR